jgi:hypothetical protein
MTFSPPSIRSALLAGAIATLPLSWASAAEPIRIVFQNGRAVPISALALQADKLVVKASADGMLAGQAFPLASADHVFRPKSTRRSRCC